MLLLSCFIEFSSRHVVISFNIFYYFQFVCVYYYSKSDVISVQHLKQVYISLFQAGGTDIMKKRAERFGTSASAASATVVTKPVSNFFLRMRVSLPETG